jgi:hypothetical protein
VPLVFAHRGGAALRPENTILAFDHGLSLGADGIEFDVRLSRDGQVVVHHDPTLERTTNGIGPIGASTAEELARLDAGYHFDGYRGRTGGIPRLDEVLRRYRDARFIIELKLNDSALALRTIDAVRAADAIDRVAIGSFGTRVLRPARPARKRGWRSTVRGFAGRSGIRLTKSFKCPKLPGRRVSSRHGSSAARTRPGSRSVYGPSMTNRTCDGCSTGASMR